MSAAVLDSLQGKIAESVELSREEGSQIIGYAIVMFNENSSFVATDGNASFPDVIHTLTERAEDFKN